MDPEINETILRLAYQGLRAKYPALNLADIKEKPTEGRNAVIKNCV